MRIWSHQISPDYCSITGVSFVRRMKITGALNLNCSLQGIVKTKRTCLGWTDNFDQVHGWEGQARPWMGKQWTAMTITWSDSEQFMKSPINVMDGMNETTEGNFVNLFGNPNGATGIFRVATFFVSLLLLPSRPEPKTLTRLGIH